MLYDKRWDKPEVKADPLTFESLIYAAMAERRIRGDAGMFAEVSSTSG